MDEMLQQEYVPPPQLERRPHDFSDFDRLLRGLQAWRNADHEESVIMSRHEVIVIIDGIAALRR